MLAFPFISVAAAHLFCFVLTSTRANWTHANQTNVYSARLNEFESFPCDCSMNMLMHSIQIPETITAPM